MDLFNYSRRKTHEVNVGNTPLGGSNPIRIQSMTNTNTRDTEACVEQSKRIIEAGGEYVRLTTQGVIEAENLKNINAALRKEGIMTPLVADVHFNPRAADVAALYAEKVRINPGNYVDSARTFKHLEYTDEEYAQELQKIANRFIPFLNICKENHTAIRIGVNHGSLSDRIMSRYGDTPEGMVESCMEFLRICVQENFKDVVISIKASNTVVMVRTVRLLVHVMEQEGMDFPLHLGVTEAGDGEDGRIKSAVGIGALLSDGFGDTIRVSLSEAPEAEIPVAKALRDYILQRQGHVYIPGVDASEFDYLHPSRRETKAAGNIGGEHVPVVISSHFKGEYILDEQFTPDYLYCGSEFPAHRVPGIPYIVDISSWTGEENTYPAFTTYNKEDEPSMLPIVNLVNSPVIFQHYNEEDKENFQLKSAADMSALLMDGLVDGIYLHNNGSISTSTIDATSYNILQAARTRISKTEYISCPSCGRTLYDLEETIKRIKAATSHLKGLKIGIMGCIVNGPGEMADADYGYVGAARGKVSLYKKKECVAKNIPTEEAVDRLLELIKENGDM